MLSFGSVQFSMATAVLTLLVGDGVPSVAALLVSGCGVLVVGKVVVPELVGGCVVVGFVVGVVVSGGGVVC